MSTCFDSDAKKCNNGYDKAASSGSYRVFLKLIDVFLLAAALLCSYALRFNFVIPSHHVAALWSVLPFVVSIELTTLLLFGCFRLVWHYCSVDDVKRFACATFVSSAVFLLIRLLGSHRLALFYPPISVTLINAVLSLATLLAVRILSRMISESVSNSAPGAKRVLIAGTGSAGNALAYALRHDVACGRVVVGFVDLDPARVGTLIQGVPVIGSFEDVGRLASSLKIDEVIIANVGLSRTHLHPIFGAVEKVGAKLLIAPDYSAVLDGISAGRDIREADISDLLRRPEIEVSDIEAHRRLLGGKRVMVTGAGGSIGSEISKQVFEAGASDLILVERSENALFNINRSLESLRAECGTECTVIPCVADIADEGRMSCIFGRCKPEIVIHAAAHKHVPLMELNVCEAICNNIFGTLTLARIASASGVERFIFLSTDKAVHPSSVMGATKRIGEMLISDINSTCNTIFSAVRFGNVLGASGSVVPIFREQILCGGPVTVTHPDMTRYFMSIPEAVHLTLEAASFSHGGEIFILDMGEPVKITELAEEMIRLSGRKPGVEIPVVFTGIRPGEKLVEELASPSENIVPTVHPQISCGVLATCKSETIREMLDRLLTISAAGNDKIARDVLMSLASGENSDK